MKDTILLSEERFKFFCEKNADKMRVKLSSLAEQGMLLDSHTIPLIAICVADFADDLRKDMFEEVSNEC